MAHFTPLDTNVNIQFVQNEKLMASHNYKEPYTVLYNQMLQTKMSTDALAIISYLNSLPKDWIVYRSQLMDHFNLSRDRINSAVNELKKLGYLAVTQERDSKGRVKGWVTQWSKVPEFGPKEIMDNFEFPPRRPPFGLLRQLPVHHNDAFDNPLVDENSFKPTNDGLRVQNTEFPHSGKSTLWKINNYKINNKYKINNNYKKTTTTQRDTELDLKSSVVVVLIERMKKEAINTKTTLAWIKKYGVDLVSEKLNMLHHEKPSLRKTPASWIGAALRDDYKCDSFMTTPEISKSINNTSILDKKCQLGLNESSGEHRSLFEHIQQGGCLNELKFGDLFQGAEMYLREPTIRSKEENQKFWKSLSNEERSQITKEAKHIMPYLESHMEGISENDESFLEHFSFEILMDILRRPSRPPYTPKS